MLCGLRAAPPAFRSRVANPTRQSVLSGLCCPLTHLFFNKQLSPVAHASARITTLGTTAPVLGRTLSGFAFSSGSNRLSAAHGDGYSRSQPTGAGCVSTAGFQLLWSFTYHAVIQSRAGDLERSLSPSPALRRIAENQPLPDRCLSYSFLKTSSDRDS